MSIKHMDCVLIKDTTGIPLNIISVLKKTDMWVTVNEVFKNGGFTAFETKDFEFETLNYK